MTDWYQILAFPFSQQVIPGNSNFPGIHRFSNLTARGRNHKSLLQIILTPG